MEKLEKFDKIEVCDKIEVLLYLLLKKNFLLHGFLEYCPPF